MRVLSVAKGSTHSFAFWPRGGVLATTHPYSPSPLRLWDLAAGEVWAAPGGELQPANGITFSADGTRVAFGGKRCGGKPGGLELWEVAPDGRSLIPGWPRPDDPAERTYGLPMEWWVDTVAFSPAGRYLLATTDTGHDRLSAWELPALTPVKLSWPCWSARSIAIPPDGWTAMIGGKSSTAQLWDLSDLGAKHPVRELKHRGQTYRLAFARDGRTLAVSASKHVTLWDVPSWEVRYVLPAGGAQRVLAVAFSPDGRTLATAAGRREVRLWDTADGRMTAEFSLDVGSVRVLAFAPDGMCLAAGGGTRKFALIDVDE